MSLPSETNVTIASSESIQLNNSTTSPTGNDKDIKITIVISLALGLLILLLCICIFIFKLISTSAKHPELKVNRDCLINEKCCEVDNAKKDDTNYEKYEEKKSDYGEYSKDYKTEKDYVNSKE